MGGSRCAEAGVLKEVPCSGLLVVQQPLGIGIPKIGRRESDDLLECLHEMVGVLIA
ncbi:hypothetical protein D3C71_1802110 [compost metagenome]